jgi:hypothetical protein
VSQTSRSTQLHPTLPELFIYYRWWLTLGGHSRACPIKLCSTAVSKQNQSLPKILIDQFSCHFNTASECLIFPNV